MIRSFSNPEISLCKTMGLIEKDIIIDKPIFSDLNEINVFMQAFQREFLDQYQYEFREEEFYKLLLENLRETQNFYTSKETIIDNLESYLANRVNYDSKNVISDIMKISVPELLM